MTLWYLYPPSPIHVIIPNFFTLQEVFPQSKYEYNMYRHKKRQKLKRAFHNLIKIYNAYNKT